MPAAPAVVNRLPVYAAVAAASSTRREARSRGTTPTPRGERHRVPGGPVQAHA